MHSHYSEADVKQIKAVSNKDETKPEDGPRIFTLKKYVSPAFAEWSHAHLYRDEALIRTGSQKHLAARPDHGLRSLLAFLPDFESGRRASAQEASALLHNRASVRRDQYPRSGLGW